MRSFYEPLSKKRRAEQHRLDAMRCERAGFPGFARVNAEMAEFLDPPEPEDEYEGY